jgi:stage II sporulation protein GA (sporulation sigma-E factor processing peptidase)
MNEGSELLLVVYADIVWLLNICIDFILLSLTALILKKKCKWYRVLLGAFIGSWIVIFLFTPLASIISHPLSKIAFSFAMVFVTFGFGTIRAFIQTTLMFYFVTFMVGGGLIGLHYFLRNDLAILDGIITTVAPGVGDPISWLFVFIAFPFIVYFSRKRVEHLEITKIHFEQIVFVEVIMNEKVWKIKGLIDSGNALCDPLTQTPVMIIDLSKVHDFVPAWLHDKSKHIHHFDLTEVKEGEEELLSRVRIIPYRGVGQHSNFMLAIRPDEVRIITKTDSIVVKKVLVGLNHTTLSANEEYECILHPKMMLTSQVFSA